MVKNKDKLFLITGGAGFVGSNLTRKLLKDGFKVIIIDDLSSGKLSNIPNNKELLFYNSSIQDFDFDILPEISCVFHLAAQASVPISIEKFYHSSSNNLLSSNKIIDFCSQNKIPLVYASSSAVYGNIKKGYEDGDVDLIHPYSVDKFTLELYAKMAFKAYGLKSCGLRFFNIYGPYQDGSNPYSGVISIFIEKILEKKTINIHGGHQTRDFIYIDDVIDAILLSYKYIEEQNTSDVFNVLSGNSTSIEDVARLIGEILDIKPTKVYSPLDDFDPEVSIGNTSHLQNLDFYPKININRGLELTINWMKSKVE